MGFVGFLKFALKCFHLLAWPFFAMVYPLYSSIRAIETNSIVDMRNLVAYWILFSLISLSELAFAKLIEWLPIWPSIKLMIIFWLVLPHFEGAQYVYEHLVYRCLSLKPHVVIKQFINPKEDTSLDAECFLAAAERYVKENGSEALEKLIATKCVEPNISETLEKTVASAGEINEKSVAGEIKVVETPASEKIQKEWTCAATTSENTFNCHLQWSKHQSNFKDLQAKENPTAGEPKEKNLVAATERSNFKDGQAKENRMTGEPKEKNLAVAKEKVKHLEPNLAPTKGRIVPEGGEIKGKAVAGEIKAMEIPALEQVQKEWTCAVCQVRTSCEKNLNDHLQGRKHLENCKALKASKLAAKSKGCSPSTLNQEPKKSVPPGDSRNRNKTKKQEEKLQARESKFWCSICNVRCPDGVAMEAHLRGKKHLSRIQEMIDSSSGGCVLPDNQV